MYLSYKEKSVCRDGKQRRRRAASWSGGKGFYIALALCVLALGTAGWLIFSPGQETKQEEPPVQQAVGPAPSLVLDPQSQQEESEVKMPEQAPPELPQKPAEEEKPQQPLRVGRPLEGEILAVFSVEQLQYNETTEDWRTHDGIDIAAAAGTGVTAACAGTVVSVENDDLMGTTVVISHEQGYQSCYSGLQEQTRVAVGDYVSLGEVIGTVGNTTLIESGQGAHLHFSVSCHGESMDPEEFFKL